ncbi:S-adenosyl-L-methionine-dependent methyltransferase [Mycena capillaripes]|nr:S-adenosyl-L-methionine-dependent methyltransferase [Mycena capillaripes]
MATTDYLMTDDVDNSGTDKIGYNCLDRGLIPDFVVRCIIRALCRQRLREIDHGTLEDNHAAKMKWIEDVRARVQIAEVPERANEHHYEVSTPFVLSFLGPTFKYSSGLYPTGRETLDEAQHLKLESYCEKLRLKDGQDMLDIGCGWGGLSLYFAQKYPNSKITGLSNSATQKAHIDATAKARGLTNLEVSSWLRPTAKEKTLFSDDSLLLIVIFCHRTTPYHFDEADGWMSQNFFSGGTMPSHDLMLYFQSDLTLVRSWYLPGTHYSRTCED